MGWDLSAWLPIVQHELLLFTGIILLLGAVDELAIDAAWLWLRLTGRGRTQRIARAELQMRPLSAPIAVLIPLWREEKIIGQTLAHTRAAWPQADLRLYLGCYRNDPSTAAAAHLAASEDPRVRIVQVERDGPTTKADCLNGLYRELCRDEEQAGRHFRAIVLHDAEDLVDPAALCLIDQGMEQADFIQLPVLPLAEPDARWIGGHYVEEFAESHGKAMVVRDALGAALPAAGVGCAFSRDMVRAIAMRRADGPFAADSLTEDYELGIAIKGLGGRSRFLRMRGDDGRLIATRAAFPDRLPAAVRQKARWVHGIALQGWDRMGWPKGAVDFWMFLRDRRGPMNALMLGLAYALPLVMLVQAVLTGATVRFAPPWQGGGWLAILLWVNVAALGWRLTMRFCFTAREYGVAEALRAILRVPMANLIAILAGGRAMLSYLGTLRGQPLVWDKTSHTAYSLSSIRG